jgi:hypothetical protein
MPRAHIYIGDKEQTVTLENSEPAVKITISSSRVSRPNTGCTCRSHCGRQGMSHSEAASRGGRKRAEELSSEKRRCIARLAAAVRWGIVPRAILRSTRRVPVEELEKVIDRYVAASTLRVDSTDEAVHGPRPDSFGRCQ